MTHTVGPCLWHLDAAESLQGLIDELARPLAHPSNPSTQEPGAHLGPRPQDRHRLAVVGSDVATLQALREQARQQLIAHGRVEDHDDIFHTDAPLGAPGVALVFPGQGSQHPGMLSEWLPVPEFLASLLELDEVARPVQGRSLKTWFFDAPEHPDNSMAGTHAAQTALGYACSALARTLTRFGVQAGWAVGHSYGELVALWHAGAYDDATLMRLTHERGQAMAQAAASLPSGLAAVSADGAAVAACLKDWPDLEIANLNAPAQTVVGGPRAVLDDFAQACQQKGWRCVVIQGAAAAFHTSRMQPALSAWHQHLLSCASEHAFRAPSGARVIANLTASAYPREAQGAADFIANSLHRQVTSQVRWVETCQTLYAAGVRLFIEVGPGQVLSKLIKQNLGDLPHRVIACSPKGDTPVWHRLARLLAELAVHDALQLPRQKTPTPDNQNQGPAMKRDTQLIEAFLQENTRIVERYFALMDRVLDRALDTAGSQPVATSVLQQMLSDTTRLTHAHLQVHENLLAGQGPLPDMARAQAPAQAQTHALPHVAPPTSQGQAPATDQQEASAQGDLLGWLKQEISQLTGFAASAIDPQARFEDLGVDSLAFMDIYTRLSQRMTVSEAAAEQILSAHSIADVMKALGTSQPATQPSSDLAAWLKARIAEATGFAASDIDTRAALEDLGIDSLARTDLFEALGQAWPQARRQASALFEARSIDDIVSLLDSAQAIAPQVMQAQQAPQTPQVRHEPAPEQAHARELPAVLQDLKAQLLSALGPSARQAGVVLDEATPFQAMSLNGFERARLWGQAALWQAPFKLAGEALISVSSVKEGLDLLASLPQVDAPKKKDAAGKPGDRLQRYRHTDVQRQVPESTAIERLLLIGADTPRTAGLASALREAGTQVRHLVVDRHGWHLPGQDVIALGDASALASALEPMLKDMRPCVAAFVTQASDDGALGTQALDAPALALFALAKALGSSSTAEGSSQGGPAITRLAVLLAGHPVADAGARGVARALSHEWRTTGVTVSSVDVDGESELNAALALAHAHPGKHDLWLQAGKAGERIADPHPEIEPPANATLDLDEQSVVLLFGGGVGIAAEVGIDLAKRYRSHIVAIGRTPWDEAHPQSDGDDAGNPGAQADLNLVRRQKALAHTAQRVREAGGQFHYFAADLTQGDAVERVIEQVADAVGPIDMVIHAAGVVEDRGLGTKPVDSFLRVFQTKAHSAWHLRSALARRAPKYIVFFSSLVSHTGNAGQTDYCAGNEVLNAMATEMAQACPDSRVVSLLWSVWHETGLANQAVQRRMAHLGMSGIGNADGTRRFHAELTRPTVPDWLLISCPRMLEVMQGSTGTTTA